METQIICGTGDISSIRKITTHAGKPSNDEMIVIADLQLKGFDGLVERKNEVSPEDLQDPSVLVLDKGLRYEPALNNIDHHQDEHLPSSCILALRHFEKNEKLRERLEFYFFQNISDTDCGIIPNGGPRHSFNGIFRNFNNLPGGGWDLRLLAMKLVLQAARATATRAIEQEPLWDALPRIGKGKIVVQKNQKQKKNYIPDWELLAKRDGVLLRVFQGRENDEWFIQSPDTEVVKIPKLRSKKQVFRHNSGFLAKYTSEDDATKHAQIIVKKAAQKLKT